MPLVTSFRPEPVKIQGPKVVGYEPPIRRRRGEVDVRQVGNEIDPVRYQEELRKAQERAGRRRF